MKKEIVQLISTALGGCFGFCVTVATMSFLADNLRGTEAIIATFIALNMVFVTLGVFLGSYLSRPISAISNSTRATPDGHTDQPAEPEWIEAKCRRCGAVEQLPLSSFGTTLRCKKCGRNIDVGAEQWSGENADT